MGMACKRRLFLENQTVKALLHHVPNQNERQGTFQKPVESLAKLIDQEMNAVVALPLCLYFDLQNRV
jgi:hypothetical protein